MTFALSTPRYTLQHYRKGLLLLCLLGFAGTLSLLAQRSNPRSNPQDVRAREADTATAQVLSDLPDSIILYRFQPSEPKRQEAIADSALSLAYVRYDPITRHGPDFVYLNSLVQPAAANPLLGKGFRPYRQLVQETHPAYAPLEAPFLGMNVPYAYTAYNQGGEVDDGQVRVLFGSPFANGWQLGMAYQRTYPSGRNNRYPSTTGDRIQLATALAYAPDSSHHRGYASLQLNSWGFNNAGGYTFALDPEETVPETPFTAVPLLRLLRTEGRRRGFSYLHRDFLREQNTAEPLGWAAAAEISYHRERQRTATTELDTPLFEPFIRDDRGLRHAVRERTVLAKAYLEYFNASSTGGALDFDLRAGVYGGRQRFEADFLPDTLSQNLFGLNGRFSTTLYKQFALSVDATLPLDDRAALGQLNGRLSWTYRQRFGLEAFALLERVDAPFAAEYVGANDYLLQRTVLPTSTHTRLGAAASYQPLGARLEAYLESFAGGWVYGPYGIAQASAQNITIPTLDFSVALAWKLLRFDNRGILRGTEGNESVYLPAYTGQHSLYLEAFLFKRAMQLIGGFDAWVRSPTRLYGYAPLTSVFYVDPAAARVDWQYTTDIFLAFKVQSFKLFVRLDNVLVSDLAGAPPRTVTGFPVIRSGGSGFSAGLFRLGISFSLYN